MNTETKPILIGTNTAIANTHKANWEKAKAGLQKVLDAYNLLGLPPINSMDELCLLFTDLPAFIYTQTTGGGLTIRGANKKELHINGNMALQLIGKPTGYDTLEATTKHYAKECLEGYGFSAMGKVHFSAPTAKEYFVITDGKLDFTDTVKEKINDAGNLYATTPKGQAFYRFFEKLTQAALEEGILTANERENGIVPAERLETLIHKYLRAIDTKTKKPLFLTSGYHPNPTPFLDR